MALPEPIFFDTDETTIISEMVADYEAQTGKKLSPAQAEQLLINSFAFREKMIRIAGNEAAKQNLLAFARYPMLDYLGELLGVERLPESKAECTLIFTMVTGHPDLLLPAGVRVQSTNGKAVFTTLNSINVLTSDNTVRVVAECTVEGADANNYQIGDISILLDPQAFVGSVQNSDITSGGADQESDDALRERIRLAPSSFSTAGPDDAYIYFAKSAHPAIIDVAITSPNPGDVNIYPLLTGGVQPSQEIIDAVLAACNPEKVRPLNDNVSVDAPDKVDYSISVRLTLLKDAVEQSVVDQVTTNLTAYSQKRQTKLGIDVMINQIKGQSMILHQVYDLEVLQPTTDITIDLNEFANCTGITVAIAGYHDE